MWYDTVPSISSYECWFCDNESSPSNGLNSALASGKDYTNSVGLDEEGMQLL